MIITDNTPKSPVKASTPLLSGASGSAAPPAYAPRDGAGPTPINAVQAPYAVHQPVYTQQRGGGHQSAGRRFCLAFLVAFGIWILASALLGSIVDERPRLQHIGPYGGYPIPDNVELEQCLSEWSEAAEKKTPYSSFPYSTGGSFDVPLPSETLLLLSQGALSAGNLKITTSSELTDLARVHITVHYYNTAVRDSARVCVIKRKSGESGVGIFTPKRWRNHARTDRLYFEVQLILPRSTTSSPLYINRLATDVSNFSHDVDALKGVVNFGELILRASNGKIQAQDLTAPAAAISSSNGAISGYYKVSDSLDLTTSNGAIQVTAVIDAGESTAVKKLTMRTSNNVLESAVSLGTSSGTGGNFLVKASTSNGRLTTGVVSAPLDSVLTLDARTTNTAATLTLPTTYEGAFEIDTSNAVPLIKRVNPNERDPACKSDAGCRTRVVNMTKLIKGKASGSVYWDRKNEKHGKVTLRTSNAPITLFI
ncbi:hypothetical protein C8R44DRAFT_619533 [Mycena epipterygia]|nr:hypothetical protein C8R44DRAFT_619533 [Mycena epipterygia]